MPIIKKNKKAKDVIIQMKWL